MNIVFCNQKGGVGKTTLTLLTAGVLKQAGYDIAIRDLDPQGSASLIGPNVMEVPLIEDHPDADYVVTDTPPRIDDKKFAKVIAESDRIILVTGKSPMDVLAAQPMAELIKTHKSNKAKAYVLFNGVESRTAIGMTDGEKLAKTIGMKPLHTEIPHSSRYERMVTEGLPVLIGKWREKIFQVMLEILK